MRPEPGQPRSPLRSYFLASLLGLLGLALGLAKLPLLSRQPPELNLAGVAVLLSFVWLGTGPGLACGLVAFSRDLLGTDAAAAAALVSALEAWIASLLYRRNGSLILSVVLYWCGAGWALDAALYGWGLGLARERVALLIAQQAFGGVLKAVAAELLLRAPGLGPWLAERDTAPATDLRRHLLARTLLGVVPPLLVVGLLIARASQTAASLALGLTLPLLATLLIERVVTRFARSVSTPLQSLALAAAQAAAGRASEGLVEDVVRSPIDEIRGLASRFTELHDALAHHDPLTGLPNRKLLLDRLALAGAQARRTRESFALLLVDLDRFRVVDNALGHALGNQLLTRIAQRVQECVRPGDTVARVGGDEFALLIPRMGRMEEATETAQKVMDAIKRPFLLEQREVFVTASVGISLYPRDGADAETLLKNATAATYVAKEKGLDSYRRYTARITAKDAQRLVIESGLRRALEQGELALHYQPLVDLRTGEILRNEALLRWHRPGVGVVPAAEFIGVAEASGLIVSMGPWVVRTACAQAKAWQDRGLPFGVAVNLSARQLQQPDLLDQVGQALRGTALAPGRFEVEITESAAMTDVDHSIEVLHKLRDLGVSISVDDFGTGYSSLSYLKRLPVDVVKLDQSFVRDITARPDDAAIARAVIAMAHSLKLRVVAEGVETGEQLAFLRRLDCDAMQGHLFSPAVPPDEIDGLLAQGRTLPTAAD